MEDLLYSTIAMEGDLCLRAASSQQASSRPSFLLNDSRRLPRKHLFERRGELFCFNSICEESSSLHPSANHVSPGLTVGRHKTTDLKDAVAEPSYKGTRWGYRGTSGQNKIYVHIARILHGRAACNQSHWGSWCHQLLFGILVNDFCARVLQMTFFHESGKGDRLSKEQGPPLHPIFGSSGISRV